MYIGRTVFGLLTLFFFVIMLFGELEERKTRQNLVDHLNSMDQGPIPDLGVSPPGNVTKHIRFSKEVKLHYLTTEELMENLEDAEMRGMADDPGVLEDLRWELK